MQTLKQEKFKLTDWNQNQNKCWETTYQGFDPYDSSGIRCAAQKPAEKIILGTVDIQHFGATPNVEYCQIKNKRYKRNPVNTKSNTGAIQNAIDYASANQIPNVYASGHYWCDSTIIVWPGVNLKIDGGLHTSTDQPFVIIYHGFATTHQIRVYNNAQLGEGNNVAKALIDQETNDASAGVVLYNCRRVSLDVEAVGFTQGLTLFGYGDGCVENVIHLRDILNNRIGIGFEGERGGWPTQNTFIGGRVTSQKKYKGFSASIAHLSPSESNTFIGLNLEGSKSTLQYCIYGGANTYINCRFEKVAKSNFKWKTNHVLSGYLNRHKDFEKFNGVNIHEFGVVAAPIEGSSGTKGFTEK